VVREAANRHDLDHAVECVHGDQGFRPTARI
jgi:hypothetical protein